MPSASDEPVLIAIRDLNALFDELGVTGVVIGGVAVSLVARERYTKDLDAMMVYDTADTQRLLNVAQNHGFEPRFSDMLELAIETRMVTGIPLPAL